MARFDERPALLVTCGKNVPTNTGHLLLLLSMPDSPKYSVVVPVYNRPEELDELLQSLAKQTFKDFEVIVVEDGSQGTSQELCKNYDSILSLKYLVKENTGPGPSRNFGFEHARGKYLVVFDSDCILPPEYFSSVEEFMTARPVDAWGGPDRGHEKFTPLQQAMAYTMSSVLTTGGIRGAKNQSDNFQPRSFNMGMSRAVYEKTGGFEFDRLAEDIELSIRVKKAGFRVALISEAWVYHKRRTNLFQFFMQVQGFGRGRVRVGKAHREEVKLTHWLPFFFLTGLIGIPLLAIISQPLGLAAFILLASYLMAILVDGWRVTRSWWIGLLSIPSAVVQLTGYGLGFIKEKIK